MERLWALQFDVIKTFTCETGRNSVKLYFDGFSSSAEETDGTDSREHELRNWKEQIIFVITHLNFKYILILRGMFGQTL